MRVVTLAPVAYISHVMGFAWADPTAPELTGPTVEKKEQSPHLGLQLLTVSTVKNSNAIRVLATLAAVYLVSALCASLGMPSNRPHSVSVHLQVSGSQLYGH